MSQASVECLQNSLMMATGSEYKAKRLPLRRPKNKPGKPKSFVFVDLSPVKKSDSEEADSQQSSDSDSENKSPEILSPESAFPDMNTTFLNANEYFPETSCYCYDTNCSGALNAGSVDESCSSSSILGNSFDDCMSEESLSESFPEKTTCDFLGLGISNWDTSAQSASGMELDILQWPGSNIFEQDCFAKQGATEYSRSFNAIPPSNDTLDHHSVDMFPQPTDTKENLVVAPQKAQSNGKNYKFKPFRMNGERNKSKRVSKPSKSVSSENTKSDLKIDENLLDDIICLNKQYNASLADEETSSDESIFSSISSGLSPLTGYFSEEELNEGKTSLC